MRLTGEILVGLPLFVWKLKYVGIKVLLPKLRKKSNNIFNGRGRSSSKKIRAQNFVAGAKWLEGKTENFPNL